MALGCGRERDRPALASSVMPSLLVLGQRQEIRAAAWAVSDHEEGAPRRVSAEPSRSREAPIALVWGCALRFDRQSEDVMDLCGDAAASAVAPTTWPAAGPA